MEMEFTAQPSSRIIHSSRYQAKTAQVFPCHQRQHFVSGIRRSDRCFLGVSLENKNFANNRLAAMLEWLVRRFSTCQILIGDSIHRITLEATRGLAPMEALACGLELGRRFLTENKALIESYRPALICDVITCSDIQQREQYKQYRAELDLYFAQSAEFRFSVENFSRKYHEKYWSHLTPSEIAYRIKRSCEYFLEEFAVFACLVNDGIKVMVYPGTFSSLADIAEGKFAGILPQLEQLIFVSLRLKGR